MTADVHALARNSLFPPITDPLYAYSLALRSHMESYDYLVSQPSVWTEKTLQRFRDVCVDQGWPIPEWAKEDDDRG